MPDKYRDLAFPAMKYLRHGGSRRDRNGDGVDLEDKIESLDFWTLGVDMHIIHVVWLGTRHFQMTL